MNLYSLGKNRLYTKDITIKQLNGKYGIAYTPPCKNILPFEYGDMLTAFEFDNILVNSWATNNFFVIKNGLYGAVHFDGNGYKEDCTFNEKPKLIYDLPCQYDYFESRLGGDFIFYNTDESAYLYTADSESGTPDKNTVIHFDEVDGDITSLSVWGRKDNNLYLVKYGKILYSEPFNGFRFHENRFGYYRSDNSEILVPENQKYILTKESVHILHDSQSSLCFNGEFVSFEYYSQDFHLCSDRVPKIKFKVELLGICEKNGACIIATPFAHTLQYIGKNRFIASCENGKFGLCEIVCNGKVETESGRERLYALYPEFIIESIYNYVIPIGSDYYKFIGGKNDVLYNHRDGRIVETY